MTEKLQALLDYQSIDLKVERIERDILSSDERKKANQMKQRFENANEDKKKIVITLASMKDELQKLSAQCDDVVKGMLIQQERLKEDIQDFEQVDAIEASLNKLAEVANKLELALKKIENSSAQMDTKLSELSETADKAREEFNECKDAYEKMLTDVKPQLEDAKEKRKTMEGKLDKTLLAKYMALRKNKVIPLVRLENKSCQGCHMELASALIAQVNSGDKYVECENCGRIIYID